MSLNLINFDTNHGKLVTNENLPAASFSQYNELEYSSASDNYFHVYESENDPGKLEIEIECRNFACYKC